MELSTFIQSCGGDSENLHLYPYTKSCFDNLIDDEKSLLTLDATNLSSTDIHLSNFSHLDGASPDLVLLWSLKALSEIGGRIHEDEVEFAEENDCYYVCIIFEGVKEARFYIETKKEDKGLRYKVWGSYSDEIHQQISNKYKSKIKEDPSLLAKWIMESVPKIEEQEGVLTYDDFGYDSDDILIGLRKSVQSFKAVDKEIRL